MKYVMSNEELAKAIEYAYQCCDSYEVGGYAHQNKESPTKKIMVDHLKELTEIQRTRAGLVEVDGEEK